VAAGSHNAYLTVGTYDIANAYAATYGVATQPASVRIPLGPGAVAFYASDHPDNVYVAFESSPYQIEVYSPVAGQAKQLVAGKKLDAVNGVTGMGPVAATASDIGAVGRALGHPLYWLGPTARDTYELTEDPDGRVYVRYLPPGVRLGASAPYLTVATYPMTNAYAVTTVASKQADTTTISLPGAVAFYAPSRPDSVYVAFKGAKAQIEVYDPSGITSRRLVAARKLTALG
jgi:hypothetical protein